MDIFTAQKAGLVKTASVAGGRAGLLTVSGSGSLTTGPVVVTSFNVALGVNNQYSPALNKSVYVYGFGDGIGKITVSGLTFTEMCDGGGRDGLARVLSFYAGTRAISDVKMNVMVGGSSFAGFLDKADIGADDPELRLGRFSLMASTLPAMMGI